MIYSSRCPFKISRHLFNHGETNFLPVRYLQSESFHQLPDREEFRKEATEAGRKACFEYAQLILEMAKLRIPFQPILFEIEGEAFQSPLSDFYRNISLFDSCFKFAWCRKADKSRSNAFIRSRIIQIGNQGSDRPHPFVTRISPFKPIDEEFSVNAIETFELLQD